MTAFVAFSAVVVLSATPANAQTSTGASAVDASIGYQLLHVPDETFPFGWNVDVSGAVNDVWRLVGEFGMSRDEQSEAGVNGTLKFYHLGAGPRIASTTGRVHPFVQLLAGAAHTSADLLFANTVGFQDDDWAFMLQPGAGVAVPIGSVVSIVGQADYRRVFFKEQGDNEFRIGFGLRFAFR